VPNPVIEAKAIAVRVLSRLNWAAAPLPRRIGLALVTGLGLTLCAKLENADGCIIPNGWDDAPYVAFGSQYQTNLLSLRVYGTDPSTGEIIYAANLSAAYLNSRFALTAAHAFDGFPVGSQLTAEVATGPNMQTNRGAVMPVIRFIIYPTFNSPDPRNGVGVPDVAILCLASNLPGPTIVITSASVGEVVTEAGFGVSGSAATGVSWDKNSRAWNASINSFLSSAYNPDYYAATEFYPYIPMNGAGANRDSGGPVTRFGDPNALVGICQGGNAAFGSSAYESGFTAYTKLSNPEVKSWIEQNTSLTSSLAIGADKTISLTGNTNLLYGLQATTNFVNWEEISMLTNTTGTVSFQDTNSLAMRAYRAVLK
jgi:hypothetical protein